MASPEGPGTQRDRLNVLNFHSYGINIDLFLSAGAVGVVNVYAGLCMFVLHPPTGKVCIQRRRLEVSFMGMREGANGLMRALWGV